MKMKRKTVFLIIGLLAVIVVYHAIKWKSKFCFTLCYQKYLRYLIQNKKLKRFSSYV